MTFNCTTNYNNHCLTIMSEIVVNMDGGVGGSWKELTEEEEAASLEITVMNSVSRSRRMCHLRNCSINACMVTD